MLLVKKQTLRDVDEQTLLILNQLCYNASKLWNVGNYEKHNYKALDMPKFPNWYDQKKRLKTNFFYKNLPSQTAQDVLQQLQEAWASFFALKKSGGIENPKPPRFKKNPMPVTFLKDAIKQAGNTIRLTIPSQLKKYLQTKDVHANFIFLKTKSFSDIHIKELQIKVENKNLQLLAVYEVTEVATLPPNDHYLSLDIGIKNSFTCYDSKGSSFIVNGFLKATHYYDKEIARLQSIYDKEQSKKGVEGPKNSKRVLSLYGKKKRCVYDFLHKATTLIADYAVHHDIRTIVLGDISGIRENKNMGRNNQQLHAFPFFKLKNLLAYKLRQRGLTLVLQNEAYSSKCSPNTPEVSKVYAKGSNRKHRGLYRDGKNIYNADSVGAYNILRLFLSSQNVNCPNHKGLSSPTKVTV